MTDPSPARVAADRGRTERREADENARRRAQEPAVAVETVPPVPAPTPDGQTGTQGREGEAWVVSSGSYSDYSVHCVCPTKRDAEAVAAKMRGVPGSWHDDARVESIAVVYADVQQVAILRLSENIYDDGTVSDYRDHTHHEWPFDSMHGDAVPVQWRWVRAPVHRGKGGRLEVSGTDHERVRKVFSERRALLRTDDAERAKVERRGR